MSFSLELEYVDLNALWMTIFEQSILRRILNSEEEEWSFIAIIIRRTFGKHSEKTFPVDIHQDDMNPLVTTFRP